MWLLFVFSGKNFPRFEEFIALCYKSGFFSFQPSVFFGILFRFSSSSVSISISTFLFLDFHSNWSSHNLDFSFFFPLFPWYLLLISWFQLLLPITNFAFKYTLSLAPISYSAPFCSTHTSRSPALVWCCKLFTRFDSTINYLSLFLFQAFLIIFRLSQ